MVAPILAGLAAQGLGLLVDAITAKGKQVVEEKLGVKIPDNPSAAEALELKKLEFAHEQWLLEAAMKRAEASLEETKAYLGDVADARGMQKAALAQEDVFSKRFLYYFATAAFSFTALYISAITFLEIPKENVRFADTVLGFLLGTLLATIVNFFFGTSRNSQAKDSVINVLTDAVTGNRRKGGQP